jgi:hypothetical protein
MSVKNTMVVMMLLSLSGFVNTAAADSRVPVSANGGVRTDYNRPSDMVSIFTNIYKQFDGTLARHDRETHIKTIIFAAGSLDNGQVAVWSNPENRTAGRVKVVLTKPVQGGYCRLLYTEVEKGDRVREYSEYACKTIDSQYWSFSSR